MTRRAVGSARNLHVRHPRPQDGLDPWPVMEFAAGALPRRAIQIDDILLHRRSERRGDAAGGNGRLYRRFRPDDDRHDRLGGPPAAGTFKPTRCRRGGGGCLRAEDRATRLRRVTSSHPRPRRAGLVAQRTGKPSNSGLPAVISKVVGLFDIKAYYHLWVAVWHFGIGHGSRPQLWIPRSRCCPPVRATF